MRLRLLEPLHADWLLWRSQFSWSDFLFLAKVDRLRSEEL